MQRHSENVTFLGMAGRDTVDAMQVFVDRYGLEEMPHAVDPDGRLWRMFGVVHQPAWAFVTPDGRVVRHIGPLGVEGVDRMIAETFGPGP